MATARQLPVDSGVALLETARAAFTGGLHAVGAVGGVIFLGLAVVVAMAFRKGAPLETDEPAAITNEALPSAAD